ncbi:MAG TPA: sulfite exporter TauE/SafE family protein, partial [Planctomycetota bacterium]|nr:sulfite exporter TauE/SafE family protein [Planctomycetota bacterium]
VDFKVAAVMIPPTLAGVEVGARVLVWLHESGKIDIVAWTYAVLLASLGVGIFIEGLHARQKAEPRRGRSPVDRRGMILLVALVGLASGFMGGLLGGGAGYLRLPALVYLIGLPTKTAVGTDLCEVVVSASYGAITHGLKGNVDFPVALAMQAGGVVGARLGARLTTVVRGATLRVSFSPLPIIGAALTILRILRRDAAP